MTRRLSIFAAALRVTTALAAMPASAQPAPAPVSEQAITEWLAQHHYPDNAAYRHAAMAHLSMITAAAQANAARAVEEQRRQAQRDAERQAQQAKQDENLARLRAVHAAQLQKWADDMAAQRQRNEAAAQRQAADMAAAQTKYLPLCQSEAILTAVRTAMEKNAPLSRPVTVFKLYNEEVFAATAQGAVATQYVHDLETSLQGVGVQVPATTDTTLPICTATALTNRGEHTVAYGWKVIDGQTFVTVQPWDDDVQPPPETHSQSVCVQSKNLGGSFYATGGNGGYDDRRGVCWTDRCEQQYQAQRCY